MRRLICDWDSVQDVETIHGLFQLSTASGIFLQKYARYLEYFNLKFEVSRYHSYFRKDF